MHIWKQWYACKYRVNLWFCHAVISDYPCYVCAIVSEARVHTVSAFINHCTVSYYSTHCIYFYFCLECFHNLSTYVAMPVLAIIIQ